MSIEMDFEGLDEFADDLKRALNEYPDMAAEALEKSGRRFVKHVKKTYEAKFSEHLTKGMKLGKVKDYGTASSIDFYAENKKNPHFHLIENGHNLVTPRYRNGKRLKNGGQIIGWVQGVKLMPKIRKEYAPIWAEDVESTAEKLLKKEGLL